MPNNKNDSKIIIYTVIGVSIFLLATTGFIFYKGGQKKKEIKYQADLARQRALKAGASRSKAEKEATLAMVTSAPEKKKVEQELEKITAGKTEQQAEVAVKVYQAKMVEENSGVVATLKTGAEQTIVDIKDTLSSFVVNLKSVAEAEYKFWRGKKEDDKNPEVLARLKKYWEEGAGVFGKSEQAIRKDSWSAAFISYVMKKAGADKDWKYSQGHYEYINDSIKNRLANNGKPFYAYRPDEVKLAIGDIVGSNREGGHITYDTAIKTGQYMSHSDLVGDIVDGTAKTFGGNWSSSVSIINVPLTKDGKIDMTNRKNKDVFVVIKNKK